MFEQVQRPGSGLGDPQGGGVPCEHVQTGPGRSPSND